MGDCSKEGELWPHTYVKSGGRLGEDGLNKKRGAQISGGARVRRRRQRANELAVLSFR